MGAGPIGVGGKVGGASGCKPGIPGLPVGGSGPAPKRIVVAYGFWIFILSDMVMFSALFATYAVLSGRTAGGPSGHELFELRRLRVFSVTSGIQPELSGRENVFLYGAVLGMGRQIIRQRFDEIVEFAGLSDAIDRQVKFYSMGMQMRLGFSVACHLDPAILLVDEVLAVGDATFQQRCLDRMREVIDGGTTARQ